jgi:NAD+ diphosphatase
MTSPLRFPPGKFAFHADALDRAGHLRNQPQEIAALMRNPESRTYILHREELILKRDGAGAKALFPIDEAGALGTDPETVFLGLRGGTAWFASTIGKEAIAPLRERSGLEIADLRKVAADGAVPFDELAAIATAKAVIQWHWRHRFCANCGTASMSMAAGWRRDCPACETQHFPRTDPVVIMLATQGDRCLLGRQSRFPPGMWSCLAGFLEPGETIEDAVRREVREETGVVCGTVRYFASQPWPYPSSLMMGCLADAVSSDIVVDQTELEDARWFSRAEAITLLNREHPDGLKAPHPFAIAYHIIARWIDADATYTFG